MYARIAARPTEGSSLCGRPNGTGRLAQQIALSWKMYLTPSLSLCFPIYDLRAETTVYDHPVRDSVRNVEENLGGNCRDNGARSWDLKSGPRSRAPAQRRSRVSAAEFFVIRARPRNRFHWRKTLSLSRILSLLVVPRSEPNMNRTPSVSIDGAPSTRRVRA